MNLHRAVSTVTGIVLTATLALIAGGLIWWQSELARAEHEISAIRSELLN